VETQLGQNMLTSLCNKALFRMKSYLGILKKYEFFVISYYPFIVFTHYDTIWSLMHCYRDIEVHFLVACRWTLTVKDQRDIALQLKRWEMNNHLHHIIHLVPDREEAAALEELSISFFVCSMASFVDEHVFTVIPDKQKVYRAIYDARLTFFKRHNLASRIVQLALITYECSANEDQNYNKQTYEQMKSSNAKWINGPFSTSYSPLTAKDVAICLNRARVGLILSEYEGVNYASIQYLLCGLPVVTTRNRGGRDVFFDPKYVVWADDSPESVADAVSVLISRELDPLVIRANTLNTINKHRQDFLKLISDIFSKYGRVSPYKTTKNWNKTFPNKLLRNHCDVSLRLAGIYAKVRAYFAKLSW
jgi:glycosyltransferase involved in cell wall biosynthesis